MEMQPVVESESEKSFLRKSKDLSFVRRMRALPNKPTNKSNLDTIPYSAKIENLKLEDGKLSTILWKKGAPNLRLEIQVLENGIIRFTVDEEAPLKARFRLNDVVLADNLLPAKEGLALTDEEDCLKLVISETHHLVIVSQPFRIEVFNRDSVILQLNSRDLLKVEPLKTKEEAQVVNLLCGCFPCSPKPPPAGDWEEIWDGQTDSKPDGPSAVGLDFTFPSCDGLYGLPERACALSLEDTPNGEPYRLYNVDVSGYELDDRKGLYGAVPLLVAKGSLQPLAVFWHNSSDTIVDVMTGNVVDGEQGGVNKNAHFVSESGVVDVFVLTGPSFGDVYKQYATLTGFPALPPMFALGLHQSRWNYFSEDEVVEVDRGYEVIQVPCDAIWLDIEHTKDKRYLEWDLQKFPDPINLHRMLELRGRKLVPIVNPHLKRDQDYSLFKEAEEKNLLVRGANGKHWQGDCWPGASSWVDFSNPAARSWWQEKTKDLLFTPNMWIDMNEPAVFNGPEHTAPKDALHYENVEHRHLHNLYGFYMQMASFEALKSNSVESLRPFLLTRSFFAGSQRYGAVWTGDNIADWNHLKKSISMVLALSLAGIPFSGADVGGFSKDPSPELFIRWVQLGAFLPFFRIHSQKGSAPRELFKQDDAHVPIFKLAVETRYSLLPYWYSHFHASSKSGMPVVRPLWMEFPTCPLVQNNETAFMVGDAILVCPVLEEKLDRLGVPLPMEDNADFWFTLNPPHSRVPANSNEAFDVDDITLHHIPAFIRAGRIVPMHKSVVGTSTVELRTIGLKIVVALNNLEEAEGSLFQDDEVSFKYLTDKTFVHRNIKMSNNTLKSVSASEDAKFQSKVQIHEVVILGIQKPPMGALVTLTSIREQTSRSEAPESREGNVIHTRSSVAVMTRKFTTQKTVPFTYDKDAQSVLIKGLNIEASYDWDIKFL